MTQPIHITDTDFRTQTAQGLTLVDFWAPWCGPCRIVAPVLDELAQQYSGRVQVVKINVDEHGRSASELGVRAIPTLMLFRDGVPVETLVGAHPRRTLAVLLDRYLGEAERAS